MNLGGLDREGRPNFAIVRADCLKGCAERSGPSSFRFWGCFKGRNNDIHCTKDMFIKFERMAPSMDDDLDNDMDDLVKDMSIGGMEAERQSIWPIWGKSAAQRFVEETTRMFVAGSASHSVRHEAIVPIIPPGIRPDKLEDHFILWEADWKDVPIDPVLLSHIAGPVYKVVGEWDLTDLEQLVLKQQSI